MNPLCLERLTISEVPPTELRSVAAAIGCQAVSLDMLRSDNLRDQGVSTLDRARMAVEVTRWLRWAPRG